MRDVEDRVRGKREREDGHACRGSSTSVAAAATKNPTASAMSKPTPGGPRARLRDLIRPRDKESSSAAIMREAQLGDQPVGRC